MNILKIWIKNIIKMFKMGNVYYWIFKKPKNDWKSKATLANKDAKRDWNYTKIIAFTLKTWNQKKKWSKSLSYLWPVEERRTNNWSVSETTFWKNNCLSSCSPNGPVRIWKDINLRCTFIRILHEKLLNESLLWEILSYKGLKVLFE